MKIGDIIVICISLLIGFSSLLVVNPLSKKAGIKYVVLTVDNKVEKRIVLDKNINKEYKFKVADTVGVFKIANNKVRMLRMKKKICNNQICSQTGWIDAPDELIVCLPNKIVLTIEGKKMPPKADTLSF